MTREQILSNIWVRMAVFAWMIVFPILFIALPALEIFTGKVEDNWTPVWGLVVWMTAPAAASVVMKYLGLGPTQQNEQRD